MVRLNNILLLQKRKPLQQLNVAMNRDSSKSISSNQTGQCINQIGNQSISKSINESVKYIFTTSLPIGF